MSGNTLTEMTPQLADPEDTKPPQPVSDKVDTEVEKGTDGTDKVVNTTLEKHAYDQDEAMKAVDEMSGDLVEVDEQTSKRLLRTIDRHLMPIMCMVYAMNFLDSMLQTLWTE